jgi:phospholipid/cholesterol/gamma-HCH transport system ATP-binding protein
MQKNDNQNVIEVKNVTTRFGETLVHDKINLDVKCGEIFALVGGSGSGKSTLLREIILLQKPQSGSIRINGKETIGLSEKEALSLRRNWGVMFQKGGLFGSLTVEENIAISLREHIQIDEKLIRELALIKISLVGLDADAANKYPNQLSGGMLKRAALARAIALDPQLLFLDEPTSGLDPISAEGFEDLIRNLKKSLGLTVMMITHDLDLLWNVADRVAILGEKHILGIGTMGELSNSQHPLVKEYFSGPRGRVAMRQAWTQK